MAKFAVYLPSGARIVVIGDAHDALSQARKFAYLTDVAYSNGIERLNAHREFLYSYGNAVSLIVPITEDCAL